MSVELKALTPASSAMPRILITEDEPLPRGELKRAFTREGFPVWEASDSEEALTQTVSKRIDIVLMDILLGDKPDGIEAARRIQAVRSEVFFIFISGVLKDDPSYLERIEDAQKNGMRVIGLFEKPVLEALPQIFEKIKGIDLTKRLKAEEDTMTIAASIDAVYREMRALVKNNGDKPGLREALVPLRERLKVLQKQEAREIEERYDAYYRTADEKAERLFEKTDRLIEWTSKQLESR